MIRKQYSSAGRSCRVTFELPAEVGAAEARVCGEFNGWSTDCQPMRRLKDGRFSLTVSLKAGQDYRFRYLLDGQRWENDPAADRYVPNGFGSDDSVIRV